MFRNNCIVRELRPCVVLQNRGLCPNRVLVLSEFLQMDKRGEHLSWLCMFWMMGGIYASFIPPGASSLDMVHMYTCVCRAVWGLHSFFLYFTCWLFCCISGWGFSMGTEFQFHSWRVFVLVCALPAIAAFVGLMFMPESPRFLLEGISEIYNSAVPTPSELTCRLLPTQTAATCHGTL